MAKGNSWVVGGKARRLSADELEGRMLDTAHALIREHGLTVSFDHLRMDDLIREADVPKTSVYRRWPSKEDFLADFLISLVRPDGPTHDQRNFGIVETLIGRHPEMMTTAEGRRAVLREAGRISVQHNFEAMADRDYLNREVALLAAVSGSTSSRVTNAVLAEIRAGARHVGTTAFYDSMLIPFQRRFRDGFSSRLLADAVAASMEGLNQARLVDPAIDRTRISRPGIDGQPVEWHLAAVSVVALVEEMTEDLVG